MLNRAAGAAAGGGAAELLGGRRLGEAAVAGEGEGSTPTVECAVLVCLFVFLYNYLGFQTTYRFRSCEKKLINYHCS